MSPQAAEQRETSYDANATLPAFHLAYHIPKSRTPDHYALEVMALILGDGESSRLYQRLVKRDEICQEVAVGTDDRRGPDLFSVWAVMASGNASTHVFASPSATAAPLSCFICGMALSSTLILFTSVFALCTACAGMPFLAWRTPYRHLW